MTEGAAPMRTNASGPKLAFAYAVELAKSTRRFAKRVSRTRDVVEGEYDAGHWTRVKREAAWSRYEGLRDWVSRGSETIGLFKIDGRIVETTTADYYAYRARALADLVSPVVGEAHEVVELGCGFGMNLFTLAAQRPDWRFRGYDIGETGLAAAREIAEHFGIADRFAFSRLDLTKGDDPTFAELHGRVAFTWFCLEQIPREVEHVVDNILAARPARVLHVEPSIDMLDLSTPRDLVSYLYLRSVDYQTRLFAYLDSLEAKGVLRVIERRRMPFAPTIRNDGRIYVWEPV